MFGKQESKDSHILCALIPTTSDSSCSPSGFLGLHHPVLQVPSKTVASDHQRKGRVLNSQIGNIYRNVASDSVCWDWGCVWKSVFARHQLNWPMSYWCFKSSGYFS